MSDESTLRKLNQEYIRALLRGDVTWYEQHLAEEFRCRKSDGSVIDKPEFLRQLSHGPDVGAFRLENVRVRIRGDTAEVDGIGAFTLKDGSQGKSCYTDIYRRMGGNWIVVSAHVTRALKLGAEVRG
jgi:hypothetical protein